MPKETEVIIKESSVSSSGSIKIPLYRVDLFQKKLLCIYYMTYYMWGKAEYRNPDWKWSTLWLAINTGKGSKGSSHNPLAAEVDLNLVVTINQTENSELSKNSGLQSSNMKSDVNKIENRSTKNEEFMVFILIWIVFVWIK